MKFILPTSFIKLPLAFLFSIMLLQGCAIKYDKPNPRPFSSPVDVEFDRYYGEPIGAGATNQSARSAFLGDDKRLIRANAPKRYTVKKGDTLWDISHKFLTKPSYWPEIWDKNQKVKNPHLIYPGDVLYIYYKGAKPIGNVSGNKLIPTIRVERHGAGMPIASLAPFLIWPRVVDKDDLTSAPYIVAARDDKLLIETDTTVYVKGLATSLRGETFGVYHPGSELRDPDTNELLGTEIKYHGRVSIITADNISTATVEHAKREIRSGDRLIKVNPHKQSLTAAIRAPKVKVRGTIMGLYDAEILSGERMVALINRGKRDGIREGHILGLYSAPKVVQDPHEKVSAKFHSVKAVDIKLPPERVGTMVVFQATDRLSYGLITESSNAVKKGYKIGNP